MCRSGGKLLTPCCLSLSPTVTNTWCDNKNAFSHCLTVIITNYIWFLSDVQMIGYIQSVTSIKSQFLPTCDLFTYNDFDYWILLFLTSKQGSLQTSCQMIFQAFSRKVTCTMSILFLPILGSCMMTSLSAVIVPSLSFSKALDRVSHKVFCRASESTVSPSSLEIMSSSTNVDCSCRLM